MKNKKTRRDLRILESTRNQVKGKRMKVDQLRDQLTDEEVLLKELSAFLEEYVEYLKREYGDDYDTH